MRWLAASRTAVQWSKNRWFMLTNDMAVTGVARR